MASQMKTLEDDAHYSRTLFRRVAFCLTALSGNKSLWRRHPPLSRLEIGPARIQTVELCFFDIITVYLLL